MTDDQVRRTEYHHGNLPTALVQAARQIIEEQGVEALSLRAAARKALVSHGAPYHHFTNKAAMLAAVATEGFQELAEAILREQWQYTQDDYLGRVVAVGRAYLDFAIRAPAVFRLMFRPELIRPWEHAELRSAESRAFNCLSAAIAECQAHGQLPGNDPLLLSLAAWSSVHGFASLWIEGVLAETPLKDARFDEVSPELLRYIMLGLSSFHPW